MKPAPFEYWDPASVEEATDFLAEHGDESNLLAGGQSLVPLLNMRLVRPEYVVDLNRLSELDYVKVEGDVLAVGALARHDTLMRDQMVAERCPLLARAAPHIGHSAIRYRGTLGGSVAHADPAAELPAVAAALDAQVVLRSRRGTRSVPAREFFVTHLTTSIEPGELVTELRFPTRPASGAGSAVMEFTRRHGDFALVGVAGQIQLDGGSIASPRFCAFGVDEVPRRMTEVERLLDGEAPSTALVAEAASTASDSVEPPSDMHASASYRRDMTGVLTRRLLLRVLEEAGVPLDDKGGARV
ncbi:MAG TPA: xanthine dehydrogenase family protein subunit M [Thermoleophilaceae bacterium]|nr:xanthine dehydrogenase family protein subunit M [Thermoleophilaceae bacterium]